MRLKKEIGILMLCGAFLLSGCGYGYEDPPPGTYTQGTDPVEDQEVTTEPQQETSGTSSSWTSANGVVILSPVEETDSSYEGVKVEVNGESKDFNWTFHKLYDPRVFYSDVTGDGKEEAVIILNVNKGTGVSIDEIHVLNIEDLSEIKAQNYEEIVLEQLQTEVNQNSDKLSIKVNSKVNEYEFSATGDPNFKYKDTLNFGGFIVYDVKDQNITVRIDGSVGASPQYVCSVHMTYKYDAAQNEFVADQIEVKPIGE